MLLLLFENLRNLIDPGPVTWNEQKNKAILGNSPRQCRTGPPPELLWKMPATFWPDLTSLMMQFAAALTPPVTERLSAEYVQISWHLSWPCPLPVPTEIITKLHGFLTPPTPITLPLLSGTTLYLLAH